MSSAAPASNDYADNATSLIALGVLAMCTVTLAHEALGHGGACLAGGGHIRQLTSSLFQCDVHARWIAPAGPLTNLTIGALALALRGTGARFHALDAFLIFVTAFAWFWEGGYCVQAMIKGDGDLYFAGQDFLGTPEKLWRSAGVLLGVALYAGTVRLTSLALRQRFGEMARARRAARWVWFGAALGATVAAATYPGPGLHDLHDAFFEVGVASVPLLWLPVRSAAQGATNTAPVRFSRRFYLLATLLYALFVVTLGHGLGVGRVS
jgi:hypothetical protein